MIMRHKRQRPDYKSYCLDKYALRSAKCALGECVESSLTVKVGVCDLTRH